MPPAKPALAALLCGLMTLTGCAMTTPGTAVHTGPAGDLFISCTIPDDALLAAGLDPATERVGFFGEHFTHAKLCRWDGPWYSIGIFALTDTIEQIVSDPGYTGIRDITVADRDAVLFRDVYDPRDAFCLLGYTTRGGTILFSGIESSTVDDGGDICTATTDVARALDHVIPR